MHIILKQYLEELQLAFELTEFNDSKLFEFFCNFCVVSKRYLGRFNPKDITTNENDASIDGIAILIDGDLIISEDDAEQIFDTHKSGFTVDIIFTQVKSGEHFKKGEISNFKLGIEDFLSLNPLLPNGEFNRKAQAIFKIILKNLSKIKNKRPNAFFYYCTSGTYNKEKEIQSSFQILNRYVESTDIFYSVLVEPLGRRELLSFWADISEKNEAKLMLVDYFGMPKMPHIPQSYVGVVKATEFINKILCDKDGNFKNGVFDENVRSFLGTENKVNLSIKKTLDDKKKKKLFSVLNNGITIVAPEMTLTPNSKEIDITNYQIINGCQTSNTLYLSKDNLDDDVTVVVKFIESPDNEVSTSIIAATNSQSDIAFESFHSLKEKAKLVQSYFNAQNKKSTYENKIYFERRENEYKEHGYQATRIFDLRELSRCYAAMFLNQPHHAARYVKLIFSVSGDNLFKQTDHESLYFCSALALYKYNTLINGKKHNAHNYTKLRWHIIQLFKYALDDRNQAINTNSKNANKLAETIIRTLNSKNKKYINIFKSCQNVIDLVGIPTDSELKSSKFMNNLLIAARKGPNKLSVIN